MTRAQTRFARKLKKYIIAEPKHIHMSYFTMDTEAEWVRSMMSQNPSLGIKLGKVCGTVGCIAGSACYLKHGSEARQYDAQDVGRRSLGLTSSQAGALFYFPFDKQVYVTPEDWKLYRSERTKLKKLTPGTQEYANVVAQALQKTIDAYGFKGRL